LRGSRCMLTSEELANPQPLCLDRCLAWLFHSHFMEPHEGETQGKRTDGACVVCALIRSEFGSHEIPIMPDTESHWSYAARDWDDRRILAEPLRRLRCPCGRSYDPVVEAAIAQGAWKIRKWETYKARHGL
jgi:hypothetical protein